MRMVGRRGWGKWLTAMLVAITLTTAQARAEFVFNVTFNDPGGANSAFYDRITSHTKAAGADWTQYFTGSGSLEVIVQFSTGIPFSTGRSVTSSFVHFNPAHGRFVYEQGTGAEIRTGIDPNGSAPDIELVFNPNYLANELWFDPDPIHRTAPVPGNKTDAMSVFLHELGHAIAFNGWRSPVNASFPPPGDFESTWDEQTVFDGVYVFFTGPKAASLYGGPVPVTSWNNFHIGNAAPGPGQDLIPDLMNGVVFFRGNRYFISPLDLAIINDTGLATVPAPPSMVMLAIGAVGVLGFGWGRGRTKAMDATIG